MKLLYLLEISMSLLFFANKLGVLIEKKLGWFMGALAATIGLYYFYQLELYVFTVLEAGLIILMGYGAFPEKWKSVKTERVIYSVIGIAMVLFGYFAFTGKPTIFETISSIGLVSGTFLLTHQRPKLGWIIYCIAHLCAAYVGYQKDRDFFADFQIASAMVSLVGILKSRNKKPLSS